MTKHMSNRLLGLLLLAGLVTLHTGCQSLSYEKTKSGLPYKIFRSGDTVGVKAGSFMKVNILQKINDSTVYNTYGSLPVYLRVDESPRTYDASEVFPLLKVGDSLVTVQMMDTFLRKSPELLSQFKRGDRIVTSFQVLGVFRKFEDYRADETKERDKLAARERAAVEQYIAQHKINAQRTPGGVYVEILSAGQGPLADTGKFVSLKYTGTTFGGVKFDSNVDSSFGHTAPLQFVVGNRQMIPGFSEGVRLLHTGARARLYIPSLLAYAGTPPSPNIRPFENLIFEIEVLDVQDQAPQMPVQQAPRVKVDTTQAKK
ncbi:MAG TPA: FKBP-type peptidyl-prolyl cis-trans isomerase [Chitinophagaceae bacterium]|nr:FKBP-type peptidyl-prolyl cis-trans isomerase [Chitinophagaceae bacterium]